MASVSWREVKDVKDVPFPGVRARQDAVRTEKDNPSHPSPAGCRGWG